MLPAATTVINSPAFPTLCVNGPNKFERRTLVVGMTNDKLFEIKDGLKDGDVVLLNPKAMVEEARKEEPRTGTPEADSKKKFGSAALKTESTATKNVDGEKKVTKDDKSAAGGGGFKPPTVADIMKQDKDSDGKISKDEASDRQKDRWDQNDTDGDGFISRAEAKAMVDRMNETIRQRQQQGGGGPGGAPTAPGGQ